MLLKLIAKTNDIEGNHVDHGVMHINFNMLQVIIVSVRLK